MRRPGLLTAAILCGGLGTRLRSVVADRPKALAPVRGRPFVTYLLDRLAEASVGEVVLLTGYRADQVQDALGATYAGMSLIYSEERTPLGTAGAVRWALPCFSGRTVLLLNGDSYCDVDLAAFAALHRRHGARASLVLARVEDASRFGLVRAGPDGRVRRFEEKAAAAGRGWINAGVYLLDRALIEELPRARPASLERDMFPRWAAGGQLHGFRCRGRFLDIGTPESYAEAERFFGRPEAALAGDLLDAGGW
jgi:NDP-sugar pyrophosphorylase family protein